MKLSFIEGIGIGVVGVGIALCLLLVGSWAGESSVADRMKSCMEISTPDQCLNQFIAEHNQKPGN